MCLSESELADQCWDSTVASYLEDAFGTEGFEKLSEALQRPPSHLCIRVNTLRASLETVVRQLVVKCQEQSISHEGNFNLDRSLNAVLIPIKKQEQEESDLGKGKHVYVSRRTGEAVLKGAQVYVPGLLAISAKLKAGECVAVSVILHNCNASTIQSGSMVEDLHLPPGAKQLCVVATGEERPSMTARDMIVSLGSHPQVSCNAGYGVAQMSRKEMLSAGKGLAVRMTHPAYQTLSCNGLLRGQIMQQSLPSLVAAHVLSPPPGSRVCDMCAAPGGKATALAQIMGDLGEIVALDRSHHKVNEIRLLAEELGITCISAHKLDATQVCHLSPPDNGASRQNAEEAAAKGQAKIRARHLRKMSAAAARGHIPPPEASEPRARTITGAGKDIRPSGCFRKAGLSGGLLQAFPEESFEFVLLDAPCSALGLRPRLQHAASLQQLQQTARYQRSLLRAAVALLKPGGSLVYSTCTIDPGENEANVRFLLDNFQDMQLVEQEPRLGGPGLTGGSGVCPERWLSQEESRLVQRFDPCGPADTEGFFIAKFRKRGSLEASCSTQN